MQESFKAMLSNFPESSLRAISSDDSGHLKQALVGLAYLVEAQSDLINDQQDSLKELLGCGADDELEGFEGRQEVIKTHLEFLREGKAKMKANEAVRGEIVRFPSYAIKRSHASELPACDANLQKVVPFSQRGEAAPLQ